MSAVPKSPVDVTYFLRLSHAEAGARTTIAQRARAIPLRIGQMTWQLDLEPLVEPPLSQPVESWLLEVAWGSTPFFLYLPADAVTQIVEPLVGGGALTELPAELAQVVLDAALSDTCRLLQALGHGTPRVERVNLDWAEVSKSCAHGFLLRLRSTQGSAAITGQLRTSASGLFFVAGLVGGRAPMASLAIPAPFRAEIGHAAMTADMLRSLETGDVLLMEHRYLGPQRVLWLRADGAGGPHVQIPPIEAGPAAPTLTIIASWTDNMPNIDDDTDILTSLPVAADTPTAASPDEIPLRLTFDVGTVMLTLGEARALQPGQVIALGHPFAGGVSIRVNGMLIGEGELVEVAGELGVSIRTLFPAPPSRSN